MFKFIKKVHTEMGDNSSAFNHILFVDSVNSERHYTANFSTLELSTSNSQRGCISSDTKTRAMMFVQSLVLSADSTGGKALLLKTDFFSRDHTPTRSFVANGFRLFQAVFNNTTKLIKKLRLS